MMLGYPPELGKWEIILDGIAEYEAKHRDLKLALPGHERPRYCGRDTYILARRQGDKRPYDWDVIISISLTQARRRDTCSAAGAGNIKVMTSTRRSTNSDVYLSRMLLTLSSTSRSMFRLKPATLTMNSNSKALDVWSNRRSGNRRAGR
jgi:hypothetical protein